MTAPTSTAEPTSTGAPTPPPFDLPLPPMPPMPPTGDDGRGRGLADRPGRVLVLLFGGLLTLALLAAGTFNVVTLIAHDEMVSAVSFPASVRHLRVAVGNGDVVVVGRTGAERDGITGTRTVNRGLTSPNFNEHVDGDSLAIDSSCPANLGWCSVSYSLSVPVGVTVDIESSSGDVTVQGVDGVATVTSSSGDIRADSVATLSAHASSGDITVAGASGPIVLGTRSGDVDARDLSGATAGVETSSGDASLSFSTAPMQVEAKTSSGDVDLVVPADGTAYRLATRTSSGSEHFAVLQDPAGERRLTVTTSSGDISVIAAPTR